VTLDELRREIEQTSALAEPPRERSRLLVEALLAALERGELRAAEPSPVGEWSVNAWVKQGILLAFRVGQDRDFDLPPVFHFRDRDTLPPRFDAGARVVPGGTTIRRGSHVGRGVVVMPPAFVNVGAWVGEGTMIDSHALVGSCAQIGNRVHLSAGAQIGGVLEPIGALPVIVEDDVFVGGGCGLFEGVRVGAGAVLAPGVILTRSVPLYDLVREELLRADGNRPLSIPAGAVVVPGSRRASGSFAERHGLQLTAPVVVKYRDAGTDAALLLESALR
jgi:2,3,4,5-tetrahydropyridine-2-carboxylate N-succinyltransferase